MKKKSNEKSLFLTGTTLLVVIAAVLLFNADFRITGFAERPVSVAINESLDGELTAFYYTRQLNLTNIQNITIEFTNTGTVFYNTTLTERIYIYEGGNLNMTAEYYDYELPLWPGMRRYFQTSYKPPREGTYYIKVLATYGVRRMEAWGVFRVGEGAGENETEEEEETPPPSGGGGWTPITIKTLGGTDLDLELDYPEIINLYQGQTVMVGAKAKNIGNNTLRRLRMYMSTPEDIEIDVNPKEVYELFPNKSTLFLLSVHATKFAQVGIHLIKFDLITDRLKQTGLIEINVTSYAMSREKEIQDRILNNRYLILEFEGQLLDAFKRGTDTVLAEALLNEARMHLNDAEDYLNIAELEKAIKELDKKDDKLKAAVFELANQSFKVYVAPGFSPFWILLIMILIAFLIFIWMERKKKKKRPRLLRNMEEESEV